LVYALAGLPYPAMLFNTSTSHSADLYATGGAAGYVRIGSVAVEPSILVQSLAFPLSVAATVLVWNARSLRPWCAVAGATAAICMLLTTSTTGYLELAVLAFFERPIPMIKSSVFLFPLGALLIVLVPNLAASIVETTVGKVDTWSYEHRAATLWEGLQAFLQHPFLGMGLAENFSSLPIFCSAVRDHWNDFVLDLSSCRGCHPAAVFAATDMAIGGPRRRTAEGHHASSLRRTAE
jgi:hypothetical protein